MSQDNSITTIGMEIKIVIKSSAYALSDFDPVIKQIDTVLNQVSQCVLDVEHEIVFTYCWSEPKVNGFYTLTPVTLTNT